MVFPISAIHANPPVTVATAGEALIDLIQEADGRLRPCNGGAVYNLTRALGLQGVQDFQVDAVEFGHFTAQPSWGVG